MTHFEVHQRWTLIPCPNPECGFYASVPEQIEMPTACGECGTPYQTDTRSTFRITGVDPKAGTLTVKP